WRGGFCATPPPQRGMTPDERPASLFSPPRGGVSQDTEGIVKPPLGGGGYCFLGPPCGVSGGGVVWVGGGGGWRRGGRGVGCWRGTGGSGTGWLLGFGGGPGGGG